MTPVATFPTVSPLTGQPLAEYPVDGPDEIREALRRARTAGQWWAGLGPRERRRRLLAWTGLLARRLDELAGLVRQETGKPLDDARLEVALALGPGMRSGCSSAAGSPAAWSPRTRQRASSTGRSVWWE